MSILCSLIKVLNVLALEVGLDRLPETASLPDASKLRLTIAVAVHPDKNPEKQDWANDLTQRLNNAWDCFKAGRHACPPSAYDAAYDSSDEEEQDQEDKADEDQKKPKDKAPEDKTPEDPLRRRVYLLTFAHPKDQGRRKPSDFTRAQFAAIVMQVYQDVLPSVTVEYFAVFREMHKNGLPHFHMAIKCSASHRWVTVAKELRAKHALWVSFSSRDGGYSSAFRYGYCPSPNKPLQELDPTPLLSDGHPHPLEAAQAPFYARGRRTSAFSGMADATTSSCKKSKRLEMFDTIVKEDIKTGDQLESKALAAYADGDGALLDTLLKSRESSQLVKRARDIASAPARAARRSMSRLALLQQASQKTCSCQGEWVPAAEAVLTKNGVSFRHFAHDVLRALKFGAQKGTVLCVVGPSNSGKSFLLAPLAEIYNTHYKPPATTSFPLIGVFDYEILLWQDYRVGGDKVAWHELLSLFEGDTVHVAMPQSQVLGHRDEKMLLPIFLSSSGRLLGPDAEQTEHMNNRVNYLQLAHAMPAAEIRKIAACGPCFGRFVLAHGEPPASAPPLSQASPSSQCCADPDDEWCSKTGMKHACDGCGKSKWGRPFCSATGKAH